MDIFMSFTHIAKLENEKSDFFWTFESRKK